MFEILVENLKKRGYEVTLFEKKEDAATYLDGKIDDTSVGCGGSVTVEELGLVPLLQTHNAVYSHMSSTYLAGRTSMEMRALEGSAKVYLSSVNGIAESGEIVNIDGTCNRVASIFYGHEKVFLLVGKNKVCKSLQEAYERARNVAAPQNARRLKVNTPCAKNADRCYDCNAEERICKGLSVLWKKPNGANIEVVLINEELGY